MTNETLLEDLVPKAAATSLGLEGIRTLGDALQKTPEQLLAYRQVGPLALECVRKAATQLPGGLPIPWRPPTSLDRLALVTALEALEEARVALTAAQAKIATAAGAVKRAMRRPPRT